VLDPGRRAARQQRELAAASKVAAQVVKRERRTGRDRREGRDRRLIDIGNQDGSERRTGGERRRTDRRRR
jgi:hypothetical protein